MMLAGSVTAGVQFAADGNSPADVDPTTGHGPEWGQAGPIGLLTIVLLCVALYFLVKSFNRNIKKIPESFDPAPKVSVAAAATALSPDAESGAASAGPATQTADLPAADYSASAERLPGGQSAE